MKKSETPGTHEASRSTTSTTTSSGYTFIGNFRTLLTLLLALAIVTTSSALADGGILFKDVQGSESGVQNATYQRVASSRNVIFDQIKAGMLMTVADLPTVPHKPFGAPGVAIFDFDGDGDLDVYATNGPGADNSLLSNQLVETGALSFLDVGASSGAGAFDHESGGVCYGDIDNDGDQDLYVLGTIGLNRMFENNGDGTFTDISSTSGLANEVRVSTSCSFGDVDNDGLLDLFVGNCCTTMDDQFPIFLGPFTLSQHNQLFMNTGANSFVDASETSGVLELKGFPSGFEKAPTITWAVAMVDYDSDGDVDIVHADDQGAFPPAIAEGIDRGTLHLLDNDGSGHFTDVVVESQLNKMGLWMGLSFGDLNGDGHLDFFATNGGDWAQTVVSELDPVYSNLPPFPSGTLSSRWFLGSASGAFSDPGIGDLNATPFGWGTSMADYDNDGDTDVIFHGGIDSGPFVHGAPGAILQNDGTADFGRDAVALSESVDHERRTVQGMAVGDLNDDGFIDIVSVAAFKVPETFSMATYNHPWDSPFDGGTYSQTYVPTDQFEVWSFSGVEYQEGDLSIEISSGDNSNRWIKTRLVGGAGLISNGTVNRDGIGALIRFTGSGGEKALQPVLGGSSYASQDSLEIGFGIGASRKGNVEVLWPGGVRNRLYGVKSGSRIVFPEIPCSFDDDSLDFQQYRGCVAQALDEMLEVGVVDRQARARFLASAIWAYFDR